MYEELINYLLMGKTVEIDNSVNADSLRVCFARRLHEYNEMQLALTGVEHPEKILSFFPSAYKTSLVKAVVKSKKNQVSFKVID